jgi:hypothetical protein
MTKYHRLGGLYNSLTVFTVLEGTCPRSRCQEGTDDLFSVCGHGGERVCASSLVSLLIITLDLLDQGLTLMNSFYINNFFKEVRVSTHELGGHKLSVYITNMVTK